MFVACVCFAVASRPKYIAATCMEFVITFSLLLLYTLKLNKKLTLFFWPLVDLFNSLFAAVFILILSLIAVSTYTVTGTLGGGALSLIAFICFVASTAAAFVTAPLIEFLAALFLLFAYSTKFNERFKGFHFPLMDFLRCVSASIIFFIISIISVSKFTDGASKAAGVFGFIATIVFALDFYFIFNDLANFLKQGGDSGDEPPRTSEYNDSDSDSD
uniref:CKLF-like MARVEL transmembrane domain containing 3 n=1 Tax=Oncorhynchus kisutch TaxID=8019 RepID=A0A8C7HGJ6_ONCKI